MYFISLCLLAPLLPPSSSSKVSSDFLLNGKANLTDVLHFSFVPSRCTLFISDKLPSFLKVIDEVNLLFIHEAPFLSVKRAGYEK